MINYGVMDLQIGIILITHSLIIVWAYRLFVLQSTWDFMIKQTLKLGKSKEF